MSNITVVVNGQVRSVSTDSSVEALLKEIAVDPSARGIAVAVNDRVVRRADWGDHKLASEDRIDVIRATQGG